MMRTILICTLFLLVGDTSVSAQARKCAEGQKQPRTAKVIEQQVLEINRKYSEMIQRGDAFEISCVLADDYVLTDESGKLFTKSDDLATYQSRTMVINWVETIEQKARIAADGLVIVNARINFKGTRGGKAFDVTEQCTTIWAWRSGRWQIVSDHISFVKE